MSNILHGSGAPLNANGNNGDYYRNTDNQDFWFKVTGIWDLIGNLNLSTPDGVGTVIFSGAGKPLNANGSNGNYYRNTDNNDLWYREGGIWKLLGSLQVTGDSLEEFSRWEFPRQISTANGTIQASDLTPSGRIIVDYTGAGGTVGLNTLASLAGAAVGSSVQLCNTTANPLEVVAVDGSGVTLEGNGVFSAQWEMKTLIIKSATVWRIVGAQ